MSVVEPIHERRVAPRVAASYRAQVTEPVEAAEVAGDEELLVPLFGTVVNLSETGVLVEVDEPLCSGRAVVVTVELEGAALALRGRVARTSRLRHCSSLFRLGIEITALPESARGALRRAVRRRLVSSYLN
jgi:hypothetical protein